jgi:hypothetical protein
MLGKFPRRGAAVTLALLASALSIAGWLALQWLGFNPYLSPTEVLKGAFWQPLTWLWLSTGALRVLLSAFLIWVLGSQLELFWGRPKFWRFCVLVPLLAGMLCLLLSWVWPALQTRQFEGGGVLTTVLWVALGLEIGRRPLNFFGFGLTGHVFAALGVLFVALEAIFNSPAAIVPSLLGLLLCFMWIYGRLPSKLSERYGSWRLKSKLNLRRKQLKLLSGSKRNTSKDSDRYLH